MKHLGAVLLFFVGACGGEAREPRAAETTSARMPVDAVPRADLDRVVRERDEARAMLDQEKARHEQDRTRLEAMVSAENARDDLASKAWATVDAAQSHVDMLTKKSQRSAAKDKTKADIEAKKKTLEEDTRKLSSVHGGAAPELEKTIRTEIDDLQRAMQPAGE